MCDSPLYKVWFERELPENYCEQYCRFVEILGPSTVTPEDPFCALPPAEAIIAAGRLQYSAAVLDQAVALKAICRTGIGIDNIDLEAATARGIAVCNAPDAPTISTAEHTITLMFAVAKELFVINHRVREGGKPDFFNQYNGLELNGLRLGLVGLGRIGGKVANLAHGVGMRVCAYDPFLNSETIFQSGVEPMSDLDELLSHCDVISLHLPLTPDTRQILNADRLASMKSGAILINTARGGLVDEKALYQSLASGHLRGAGLDVFESEPPSQDHPLLQLQNVVATPHIAAATNASKKRLWTVALEQAIDVLEGRCPRHLINQEVWNREMSVNQ